MIIIFYLLGVAHCANMYEASSNDPEGLTAARKEIDLLIGQWLGLITADNSSAKKIISNVYIACLACIIFYLII